MHYFTAPMPLSIRGFHAPRLLLAANLVPLALAAQTGPEIVRTGAARPVAQAVQVEAGPKLDGKLDDPIWARAAVIRDFVQHEPFDGRAATERTEVHILFDKQALSRRAAIE